MNPNKFLNKYFIVTGIVILLVLFIFSIHFLVTGAKEEYNESALGRKINKALDDSDTTITIRNGKADTVIIIKK